VDLELTDDQQELRRSVRSVLDREAPLSVARHVVETGEQPADLTKTMADLDWFGLSVPEAAGGMGLGLIETGIVVEELGRTVAPGHFTASMTQYVPAVVLAGSPEQQAELLAPVVAGTSAGALALADHPRRASVDAIATVARQDGDQWALEGTKRSVLAAEGDRVVVVARVADPATGDPAPDGGLGLFVVDTDEVKVRPVKALDATRPLIDISLEGTVVGVDRVLGRPGSPEVADAVTRAAEHAAVGIALELLGVCEALLELTIAYAKDRHQFGVPIGQFQAVKHKMTDDYVAVQRARALAYFALAAIDEDEARRPLAVAMAKAAAGECQAQVCQDATQTFGGIGFTWEHDLHLFTKRAKTAAALFGGASEHRRTVARLLGVDKLPSS
jgi:alkylation response protein AidB-like acyl-CoA dehydrogenase